MGRACFPSRDRLGPGSQPHLAQMYRELSQQTHCCSDFRNLNAKHNSHPVQAQTVNLSTVVNPRKERESMAAFDVTTEVFLAKTWQIAFSSVTTAAVIDGLRAYANCGWSVPRMARGH